jgi:hypothetical protein
VSTLQHRVTGGSLDRIRAQNIHRPGFTASATYRYGRWISSE